MTLSIEFPFARKRDYFLFLAAIFSYIMLIKVYNCYNPAGKFNLKMCIVYEITQFLIHLFLSYYIVFMVCTNTSRIKPSPHQILYATTIVNMLFLLAREGYRLFKTGFVVENKAFLPVALCGYGILLWVGRLDKRLPYQKTISQRRWEIFLISMMAFMICFIISFAPIYILDDLRLSGRI